MPKGFRKDGSKLGFQKGNRPLAPFQKGHKINQGRITWNKGKKCPQLSGENNGRWKNGRRKSYGYVYIYQPNHPFANKHRCIFEQRLVVEQQIGHYLKSSEKTHHLGKKDDNRPCMLMAFINDSAHIRFHKDPNNVKSSEIIFDGRKLQN